MKRATHPIPILVLTLTCCGVQRHPTLYVIEEGYTGWVHVTYDQSNSAPLPVENGFNVAAVSFRGVLSTSSRMYPSWDKDEFTFRAPDGHRTKIATTGSARLIWGEDKSSSRDGDTEMFFVGDEKHYGDAMNVSHKAVEGLVQAKPTTPDELGIRSPRTPSK